MRLVNQRRALILGLMLFGMCVGCSRSRHPPVTDSRCPDGLVSIEAQPEAPVRIKILGCDRSNRYAPNVTYRVESNSTKAILRYETRVLTSYDGVVEDFSTDSSKSSDPNSALFPPGSSSYNSRTFTLKRGWFTDPDPKLTFTVWSVTFTDGTAWNRGPAHDAKL